MNIAMVRAIGVKSSPHKSSLSGGFSGHKPISWALHWGQCGLRLFPCTRFTGLPLVPHWPKAASANDSQIVEWWSEFPDADIGAIPDSAGCYVLTAVGDQGFDNLDLLAGHYDKPLLETIGADGSLHLWFPGRAPSHRLTDGLYVFGVGSYLYMPPSLAPDPVARLDIVQEAA
jgi:hypothetical protein